MDNQHTFSLAPIQGITDFQFRNCFAEYAGGVDRFFAPYLRLDKSPTLSNKHIRDVAPDNNASLKLIPQIMTGNVEHFLYMANYLSDLGYEEINWNLGCPYPMVTNRTMGAGLLDKPDVVTALLDEVMPKLRSRLSIKLRTGLQTEHDLPKLLPLLNNYDLSEIIIHPRYAKQLYKGSVNRAVFGACLPLTKHPVCYNGDIDSPETWTQVAADFPDVKNWMIARSLIADPFLALQIKQDGAPLPFDPKKRFLEMHEALLEAYLEQFTGGENQVVTKMTAYWEHFATSFDNSRKMFKKIKKAKTMAKYRSAVREIMNESDWLGARVQIEEPDEFDEFAI